MKKSELVIIMGFTGAVGSAILERYWQRKNAVVYGISRKAPEWSGFLSKETGFLPTATFACSVSFNEEQCKKFVAAIDLEKFSQVTYVHCVGAYLFEINAHGEFHIENDHDKDGLNDQVKLLSHDLFRWISESLIQKAKNHVDCVIFGGLADKHRPRIIQSWWQVMEKTEAFMRSTASRRVGMFKFNISSVFCPHELYSRPYVFINTDADRSAWLSPNQLAAKVVRTLNSNRKGGCHIMDVFNSWTDFFGSYYADKNMVPRRLAETKP